MDQMSRGDLEVELLPARHGDAILLSWGPSEDRHRILIDGGPAGAYPQIAARMAEVASTGPLDLLVLTHIDADHIEGAILLVNDADVGVDIRDIWFNGPAQLSDELSEAQGEMFAALIGARALPHNQAFDSRAVGVLTECALPTRDLPGLRLTVLGPDQRALNRQRDAWTHSLGDEGLLFDTPQDALDALRRRGSLNPDTVYLGGPEQVDAAWVADLASRPAAPDASVPNAASIVLLAEHGDTSVLLTGDATAQVITDGLRRLLAERGLDHLELTAMKVPHHGSVRNLSRALLTLAPADHYLFSSDGGRHGHPDAEGVARVLAYGKPGAELVFNYQTPQTLLWDHQSALGGSTARYPAAGTEGIRVALSPGRSGSP